jgi:hypothetical protein
LNSVVEDDKEDDMITRILKGRALAAVAGAAMLAATATQASAFTLSAPSLEPSVAASNIDHVYWRHGWGWHGGWHRGWGWRGGWGWHHRHCWINPWGHWRCGW